MSKFLGITLIVLAIALAVVPFFTDCQSQGKSLTTSTGKLVPMKCHWTGIAEIGAAVPLVAVGTMITASRRRENLRTLGFMGILLGGVAIAFPAGLIGVCQTPTMICHTVMKPTLLVLGSLAMVGSAGTIAMTFKARGKSTYGIDEISS